jgi:hypothetical protein
VRFPVSMDFPKARKGWVKKRDISLTNEVVTIPSTQVQKRGSGEAMDDQSQRNYEDQHP